MSIQGQIRSTTTLLRAKVTNTDGRLSAAAPITLKNQIQEIRSIEDIGDVSEVNVANGATLIYNSSNDKYEVKPINISDLGAIDGGTF